jgi:hypothetical protein
VCPLSLLRACTLRQTQSGSTHQHHYIYFLIFKCVIKIVKSGARARSSRSPAWSVRKSRILQSGAAFQKSTAAFCLLSLITDANIDPNWPISGDLNEQINPHTAHVRCTKTTPTWHKRPRGILCRVERNPAKQSNSTLGGQSGICVRPTHTHSRHGTGVFPDAG